MTDKTRTELEASAGDLAMMLALGERIGEPVGALRRERFGQSDFVSDAIADLAEGLSAATNSQKSGGKDGD